MCLDILDEEDSRGLEVGLKAVAEEQKEWLKELIASGNLQPANRKIMGGKGPVLKVLPNGETRCGWIQASVSFADDDALSVEGSCVDDEYQTSENDISWEIDFPCEVLEGDWYPNVVQAHAETARLCRVLSQELGGCWDSFCFDGLFGQLRAAENQRDWYEGLLWDEFLRDSAISLRSLSTVPLGSDEPLPASEVFLQTRTVSMTEARRELPLWIPPAQEEVTSLEDVHEAVIRIQVPDIEALVKTGHRVVQVPGKAVLTRKSGVGKRRFRCVACGNFIPQNENAQSLYTTGVEGVTLRVALAYAAHMSWVGRTADIKTAFLNAPLEEGYDNGTEEIVVVRPPHILVEMGLLGVTDRWRVVKALYGLRQAPKAWAVHRDKILKAFEFMYKGSRFVLKQAIADESLWYIIKADISDANNYALMVVYVDDILGLGPRDLLVSLFEAIKNIWTISEPEWIVKEKSVKFCGIELWALDDGFRMSQSDYLRELFARYNISTGASCPMSSWSEPEPEVDATTDLIKEAQGVTGALLWAASKSRPDISYSVCKLGQYATKSPGIVVKAGMQILKYLFDTVELGIEYKRTAGTAWLDTPIPRTVGTVEVFTDASHAPEGARSHQAIMVMWLGSLIAWDSSRQPFTTLSSAESELVAIISGVCAAESVGAILEELGDHGLFDSDAPGVIDIGHEPEDSEDEDSDVFDPDEYGPLPSWFSGAEDAVPVSGELTEFPYVIWAPSDFVHYLRRLLALNGATMLSLLGNQSVEWVRLRTVSRSFQSGVVLALVVWLQGRGMISRMLDGPVSYDVATAYITGRIAPDSESEDEALDDYPHRDPAYQQHPPVPVFAQMFQEAFEEATSSDASVTSTTEPSVWSASSSEVEELGQVEEVADSLSPSAEAVAGVRYEAEDGKLLVYYVDDVLVVPLPGWSLAQVLVVVQGLRTGVWDNFQEALEAVSGDGAEAPGS
ncbi:RE2 [Symbiodinium sp. CCMP2592]|nr:RE2 [Symbiodinium sp. CCMP2592]